MPPEISDSPDGGGGAQSSSPEYATPRSAAAAADVSPQQNLDPENYPPGHVPPTTNGTDTGNGNINSDINGNAITEVVASTKVMPQMTSPSNNANGVIFSYPAAAKPLPLSNGTHQLHSQSPSTSTQPSSATATATASASQKTPSKDQEDIKILNTLLSNASPDVHHQVLRDNWRTFLFPSSHSTVLDWRKDPLLFVLRAGLRNAEPASLVKLLDDPDFFTPEVMNIVCKRKQVRERVSFSPQLCASAIMIYIHTCFHQLTHF